MVSRKTRIGEFETDAAIEACLAIMHNKVPVKKTDPGSFTIPCSIGNNYSTKAFCDPGASINLMPKSVFQKLGIGEAKPTTVMLQLADCSYIQPEGKIEDILGLETIIYQRLHELGWLKFGRQPARANINWAREFYAHNASGANTVVNVRGRLVPAHSATINLILDLLENQPSIYQLTDALEDVDYNDIKDALCLNGTKWYTTGRNP
ncbi:hypothetical protein V6N13_026595 [Hibiscus sabdariffa]